MPENPTPSKVTRHAVARRLWRRLIQFSAAGIGTYILDICIVGLLVFGLALPTRPAVGIGFLIGLTANYHLNYHWVFRGTPRNKFVGYAIFAVLALLGIFIITQSVTLLVSTYHMHILVARTVVAAFVGLVNFFINTFFNFKLV